MICEKEEWVQLFLDNHAKFNTVNCRKNSPLDSALSRRSRKNIYALLVCAEVQKDAQFIRDAKDNLLRFRDSGGKTILHGLVEYAQLKLSPITLKECVVLLDMQDNEGYTPLHWAVVCGKKACVQCFLDNHAKFNTTNHRKNSPLDSALSREHDDIIYALIHRAVAQKNNEFIEYSSRDELLKYLEKPFFSKGSEGVRLEKFSEYQKRVGSAHVVPPPKLGLSYLDYRDTSGSSSSDSESEKFIEMNKKAGLSQSSFLYRGLFFNPFYFQKARERREVRKKEYHDRPVYSWATEQFAVSSEYNGRVGYEKADRLVRAWFELLKYTPVKRERYEGKLVPPRAGNHSNHCGLLIQVYKNSYSRLVNEAGLLENFNFISNHNPFVSTSKQSKKAMEYITRALEQAGYQLLKHRRAQGTFKHRRFGYMMVINSDLLSSNDTSLNMSELNESGFIHVSHHYKFDDEVAFVSSVPKHALLGVQVFAMPSFRKPWSSKIQEDFGLGEVDYNNCKELLHSADHPGQRLKIFVDKVVQHQINKLSFILQTQFVRPEADGNTNINSLTENTASLLIDSTLDISVIANQENVEDSILEDDLKPFGDTDLLSNTHMRLVGEQLVQGQLDVLYSVFLLAQELAGLKKGFEDWAASLKKFFCIALNQGEGHWIFGFFSKTGDKNIRGMLFDPRPGRIYTVHEKVMQALENLGGWKSFVSHHNVSFQKDSFNGGIWVLVCMEVLMTHISLNTYSDLWDLLVLEKSVENYVSNDIQACRDRYREIYASIFNGKVVESDFSCRSQSAVRLPTASKG